MSGSPAKPAWQTDELQDEWVDLEPESSTIDETHDLTYGTRSVSFTAPLTTHIATNSDSDPNDSNSLANASRALGTVVVREDVPAAPLLPKTPGRNKGIIKDIFAPLALERMFEPPSPPIPGPSSRGIQDQEHTHTSSAEIPKINSITSQDKANLECRFTFSVPRDPPSLRPSIVERAVYPQAQSTPNPPFSARSVPPATDPRLRLFHFQYDTYTREHLSAMVDSIAVNTPSGGTTPSTTSFNQGLSRVSEATGFTDHIPHLRSTKRLKLSPASDFYGEGAGANASISRPKLYGKDYVGESKSLMQKIKLARDFSTISTVASQSAPKSPSSPGDEGLLSSSKHDLSQAVSRRPSFLGIPSNYSNPTHSGTVTSKSSSYTSSSYRQQATALMAQIKSDIKGQKRIFSGETDVSGVTVTPTDESEEIGQIALVHGVDDTNKSGKVSSTQRGASSRSNSSWTASNNLQSVREASQTLSDRLSRVSLRHTADQNAQSNHISPVQIPDTQPGLQPLLTSTIPSYPSSSVRARTNEDLNRFVSSSTASGTTVTAGSAPSFVKHAGPPHLRTIAPEDLPTIPDRFGDMIFDKAMMKWVKNTVEATRGHDRSVVSDLSEDPFGDIESLRDERKDDDVSLDTDAQQANPIEQEVEDAANINEMTRIDERSEVDDDEEIELTSFSTDASAHVANVMAAIAAHGIEDNGDTTDSADEHDPITRSEVREVEFDTDEEGENSVSAHMEHGNISSGAAVITHNTPSRAHPSMGGTPIIRSAMKSRTATPSSVLKDSNRHKYQTPVHTKSHRRSVSFSDGKRDGPIRGLHSSPSESNVSSNLPTEGAIQSVRSKRIADMMNALEDSDLHDESPSKASSTSGRPEELIPLSSVSSAIGSGSSRRNISRSHSRRHANDGEFIKANGTFLTECSFGVAHDRLVEVITDVQPFEPHWEALPSIDLSEKKLESVARLKEFLPRLDALNLNSNQLSWLSGVPGFVRSLSVAHNHLTGLTSYSHLVNLENLDISYNDIDSLRQLDSLRHLRELKADGNKIASIDGLQRLDGLAKLSLQGNKIESMDLTQYRWSRLEMLNVSCNRLNNVRGIASLQSLIALNFDNNQLGQLELDESMARLRILRVSGNRLQQLEVSAVPNLRTLYADNNALSSLAGIGRLSKLENLSLRNQSGRGLNLLTRDVRDVKRLYLSGNPLKTNFLDDACYNLVYLELAACRLTALPEGLSRLVPNLRVLNLNYNFLEDARPLEGLTRLQKLTIIGSRLKNTKPLIRLLQRMPDVEMLDFRMNPCTLGWYLPLLVKDVPGALQPSEGGGNGKGEKVAAHAWQELDSKFRRDLPDESYIGRLAYRGLVMRACPRIRMVDGVGVSEKERTKADQLLQGILGKKRSLKEKGS
ncbi:hypothetical protein BDQ17DRAFT_1343296 [Cyathus striatus]|nr:hypothetical protein BDQ17DRAFT_1343296 [Cyathus striatus]